jgi:hypothetical protein
LWPPIARASLKIRQPDGSFWDYPMYGYHKFYGTGYAREEPVTHTKMIA